MTRVVALAVWLVPLAAGAGEKPASVLALSADEKKLVQQLADEAITRANLRKGKLVYVGCEVFRDRQGGRVRRMVLATHYRYDGDVAIQTSIDFGKGQVVNVEAVPHMPTSLAPEEFAEAEKLARADREVMKILANEKDADKLEVDALMHYTADEKAPTFHHRVVRLFFRHGRNYLLYGPVVVVDLTARTVRVEERFVGKHP